jgi:hypothetical protein
VRGDKHNKDAPPRTRKQYTLKEETNSTTKDPYRAIRDNKEK